MTTEVERLTRRLERERAARREAERIAEETTRALYAEVAERTRELESVVAMGREVAAALESHAVGDLIARHIATAVGFDECGIYAWERAEAVVRTVGYHPTERRAIIDDTFSLAEYPETLKVLESRAVSVIDASDPSADSAELKFLVSLGGRRMFQIPMVVNQQAIGTVELLSHGDAPLNERQIAIAQTMASEAGVLIENARLYAQVRHQAFYDDLTGLPNRALFGDRLGHALARRTDDLARRCAVFFVDVDDFKDINDHFGHAGGDEVLAAVGDRLQALMRPGDTVARLSRRRVRHPRRGCLRTAQCGVDRRADHRRLRSPARDRPPLAQRFGERWGRRPIVRCAGRRDPGPQRGLRDVRREADRQGSLPPLSHRGTGGRRSGCAAARRPARRLDP